MITKHISNLGFIRVFKTFWNEEELLSNFSVYICISEWTQLELVFIQITSAPVNNGYQPLQTILLLTSAKNFPRLNLQ